MFDFVRKHTRILFIILLLLVGSSFVFENRMSGVRDTAGQRTIAKVGGHKITQAEWDRLTQQRLESIRRESQGIDIKMFDTPAFRQGVLDELVRQRVVREAVQQFHLGVTDERLQRIFATDPQFGLLRNPDGSVNKAALISLGLTSAGFVERLRQDLAQQQVLLGVSTSSVVPASVASPALDAVFQQREVQVQRFDPKSHASKVNPGEAELEAFYKEPAVAARFQLPEQVDVEYVVLEPTDLAKDIAVPDEEVKKYYDDILKATPQRFGTPDERRVSHILIAVEEGASEEVRAKAKAKAQALLETLKKNPRTFAEVAQKNSQDAGSAKAGGDLGYLQRGGLVDAFGDALFALKAGELSGVVQTDQGYHILLMTGQRGNEIRSFDTVKAELLAELRKDKAQKGFTDASQEFSNMVYEQADTLKPVADKWKLEVRIAKGLTRNGTPGDPVTGRPEFVEAVFAPASLKDKRNSGPIELGGQIAAARVLQHTPARQPPLAEVQPAVRAAYVARESAALARKEGEARLAELKAAPPTTLGQPPELVSRAQPGRVPQALLEQVLRAPTQKLPVVLGFDAGEQGYQVVLLTRVTGLDPVVAAAPQAKGIIKQAWDDAEGQAYVEALKTRFKVEVMAPQK